MKKEYQEWLKKIIPTLFIISAKTKEEYLSKYGETIKIRDILMSKNDFDEIPTELKKILHL